MRKIWNIFISTSLTTLIAMTFIACGVDDSPSTGNSTGNTEHPETKPGDDANPSVSASDFAHGADVSWLTQIEDEGYKFYNAAGNEADALSILKEECGVDAVRLRVWVDPTDKWNDIDDVITKAHRASDLGMRIMIDFHLSDTWADPSNQKVPASWEAANPGQELAQKVNDHVSSVLMQLKRNGITPEWVQIGNETSAGMLWESGRVQGSNPGEFVRYFNAGAAGAKSVFPDIKVILHLNNGHDNSLFKWFFDLMKKHKADYDIIGMSLYPETESGSGSDWHVATDQGMVKHCKANIRSLYSSFGKPVIITEIGFHHSNGVSANEVIKSFISDFSGENILQGIFYWEPEAPEGFNDYHKGAFENGRPNDALNAFVD